VLKINFFLFQNSLSLHYVVFKYLKHSKPLLSTTLVKFEKVMAPLTNNEKKSPLLPMVVISGFERNCGTFKGGGGRNPLLSMTQG
jgi:hypothetical protein